MCIATKIACIAVKIEWKVAGEKSGCDASMIKIQIHDYNNNYIWQLYFLFSNSNLNSNLNDIFWLHISIPRPTQCYGKFEQLIINVSIVHKFRLLWWRAGTSNNTLDAKPRRSPTAFPLNHVFSNLQWEHYPFHQKFGNLLAHLKTCLKRRTAHVPTGTKKSNRPSKEEEN